MGLMEGAGRMPRKISDFPKRCGAFMDSGKRTPVESNIPPPAPGRKLIFAFMEFRIKARS